MGCSQTKEILGGDDMMDLAGQVNLRHFDVQRVIGEGGFGQVKAVMKRKEKPVRWYAMKVLQKATVIDNWRVNEVFQERDLLTYLQHDRLCNLYYSFQDKRHLYLVMDIALGGDLRYQLNHNAKGAAFSESRARIYCAQIVLALKYVHSRGIIHRDLKPENVLMQADGWLKLTDFGISQQVDDKNNCYNSSGTMGYMAPELYTPSHRHSFQADWFSLGVMLHEILVKRRPVKSNDIIAAGRRLGDEEEKQNQESQSNSTISKESDNHSKLNETASLEKPTNCSGKNLQHEDQVIWGKSNSAHRLLEDTALQNAVETVSKVSRTGKNNLRASSTNSLEVKNDSDKTTMSDFQLSQNDCLAIMSKECAYFIQKLLKVNANERLGANGAVGVESHPWFAKSVDFDFDKIVDKTHSVPFVPDVNKMNAEPDADIRAMLIGGEGGRQLRYLTSKEQAKFDGYEFDFYAAEEVRKLLNELPKRTFSQ